MSLLNESWMPVRDKSGARRWISPAQLSDPNIVAFDADRADFNGALTQFAIGLLTTFAPIFNAKDWKTLFFNPPSFDALWSWWADSDYVFVYDGNDSRFMQDNNLAAKAEKEIAALFIDSPGANTVEKNKDLFVKRTRIRLICPHCAITATYVLQINAPKGGRGQLTGVRGGGPLTTLLTCQPPTTLWHDIWLNVINPPDRDSYGGVPKNTLPHLKFPWLESIEKIQTEQGQVSPIQVHPMHIHWAMPRRIRLDFTNTSVGRCDICHRHNDRLLSGFSSAPNGLNYKDGWDHVLSPYYLSKDTWLPVHPKSGGVSYKHWLPWIIGAESGRAISRPARVVVHHMIRQRATRLNTPSEVWAFGYEMNDMSAYSWHEHRVPVHNLDNCIESEIRICQQVVYAWLQGADECLDSLSDAIKKAWFRLNARGDYSAIDAAFSSQTEHEFYQLLSKLLDTIRAGASEDALIALTEAWLRVLQTSCAALFSDVFVGAGQIDRSDPRRVATAYKTLQATLYGPKLRKTLVLPTKDTMPAKKQATKATT